MKIFLPGGAGLVGLNLVSMIQNSYPEWEIIVVDKNSKKVQFAKKLFPNVKFINEDLADDLNEMEWKKNIINVNACVILQAEISNLEDYQFYKNNILSTKIICNHLRRIKCKRIIHISSSVINSVISDVYTKTKIEQEQIVKEIFPKCLILRPTLMFGPFDRKHLGWIATFMKRFPILPIPGNGKFIRQPLYVKDFCSIIVKCLEDTSINGTFNITGLERISYLSLMKQIKKITKSKNIIIFIKKNIFSLLLKFWSLISSKPVFTESQLNALLAGDEFDIYNWPDIFSVNATSLHQALKESFQDKELNLKK